MTVRPPLKTTQHAGRVVSLAATAYGVSQLCEQLPLVHVSVEEHSVPQAPQFA